MSKGYLSVLAVLFLQAQGRSVKSQVEAVRRLKGISRTAESIQTKALEDVLVARKTDNLDLALIELVRVECADEIAALEANVDQDEDDEDEEDNEVDEDEIEDQLAALQDFKDCVVDIFNDLLIDCFNDVPALQPVAECLVEVGLEDRFLYDLEKDEEDIEDAIEDLLDFEFDAVFDFAEIFKAQDLDRKYLEIFDVDADALNEDDCEDLFGDEEFPDVFACFLLLDVEDIEDLEDFLEDEIEDSQACQDLADFAGEDDAEDFLEDILFKHLEALDDEADGLCGNQAEEWQQKFDEVAEACSEFDDGDLVQSLESRFSAARNIEVSGFAVAFLLAVQVLLN
eukprot:augustus_masked-scaffold_9-processed-gene-0.52-mRNA-1 protein AED:1.00 eAED:1.00 QI:0/-1/0/0/-1/1/1/0/340